MADDGLELSSLTDVALDGSELTYVVKAGISRRATTQEIADLSGGTAISVADRTVLAAVPATGARFLAESGREGLFKFTATNLSAKVAADTAQGLYVAPASDPTGASGAWVRQWNEIVGRPEWFGAVRDNPGADCAAAIQACHNLCPITELGPFKYYVGDGTAAAGTFLLTMQIDGRIIEGSAPTQSGSPGMTELVINSASASGILMGFDTDPGGSGVTNWLEGAEVRNLTIRRNVATYPLANPAAGFDPAPTGLRMRYANVCKVTNVYGVEHSFGFYIKQTVACRFSRCRVLRYTAGTSPGNDFFAGFFQDNSGASPFNSGNASLYYEACGVFSNSTTGGAPAYTYNAAIQTYQGFTDTFINKLECANTGYGIDANGRSSTALDYQTEDLTITDPVLDGVRFAGIRIRTGGPNSAVQIKGHYIGCSNATGPTTKGIQVDDVHGSVAIIGGQYFAAVGNPATGLDVIDSSGVVSKGNIYTDIAAPVVLTNAVNFRIEDRINAAQVSFAQGVLATGCTRGKIDCDIATSNALLAIGEGVNLSGAGNSKIEVNVSGIDPTYMTGGAGNKLLNNAVQVVAEGAFGTNSLAKGIFV